MLSTVSRAHTFTPTDSNQAQFLVRNLSCALHCSTPHHKSEAWGEKYGIKGACYVTPRTSTWCLRLYRLSMSRCISCSLWRPRILVRPRRAGHLRMSPTIGYSHQHLSLRSSVCEPRNPSAAHLLLPELTSVAQLLLYHPSDLPSPLR